MKKKRILPIGGEKAPQTVTGTMLDVIIALIPAAFAGVAVFGIRAAAVIAITTAATVLIEYLWQVLFHREKTAGNLSGVVTGLLLSFCLPATAPFWVCLTGAFIATLVKQLFGGYGKNFLNPALTARLVLTLLFTTALSDFTAPAKNAADAVSTATPLAQLSEIDLSGNINMQLGSLINDGDLPGFINMLFGVRSGCIGETCAAALIIGGIYLILRGVISFVLPCVYILTTTLFMLFASGFNPLFTTYEILSGGLLLAAFFMLTDPSTSPKGLKWKLICGAACGIATALIRLFTPLPEGIGITVLLMNAACVIIEKKQLNFTPPVIKRRSKATVQEEVATEALCAPEAAVNEDTEREAVSSSEEKPVIETAEKAVGEAADEEAAASETEAIGEPTEEPEGIEEPAGHIEEAAEELSDEPLRNTEEKAEDENTASAEDTAEGTEEAPEAENTEEEAEEIAEEPAEEAVIISEEAVVITEEDVEIAEKEEAVVIPEEQLTAEADTAAADEPISLAPEISENISEEYPAEDTESVPAEAPEMQESEAPADTPAEAPVVTPTKPYAARKTAAPASDYTFNKKNRRGKKKKEKIIPDFSEPLPDVIPEFLRKEIEKNQKNN